MSDAAIAAAGPAPPATPPSPWKDPKGFGFRDLLDIVNPLQHLPIIGSIYRWATGDRPGEAAQMAGDALYGGPVGVAVGLLGAATEDTQGRDLGERAMAALFGSDAKTTAVAAATPPAGATAPPAIKAAQAAAPPIKLDHAPMPLFGGIALPPPSANAAAAASAQNGPAGDLLAHNAMLERQISAGTRATPRTAPVPLVVPPGSVEMPRLAVPQAPAGAPLDISHKMLDALDKYMRLEQERKAHPAAPDAAAAPSVDLSL